MMNPNQGPPVVVDSLPPHHSQQHGGGGGTSNGPPMLGGPHGGGGGGPQLCSAGGGVVGGPLNGAMRSCGGCGGKIIDRFLLHALDRYWHTTCLKCTMCGTTLADVGSSCFTKGGMILCKTDYMRMYGTGGTCSSCGQMIPAHEFVMRAQGSVYHLKCFTCVKCHNQLVPGDRYNLINGSLFCEQDCHKFLKGTVSAGPARKNAKVGRQEARQKAAAMHKAAAAAAAVQCHSVEHMNQGAFI